MTRPPGRRGGAGRGPRISKGGGRGGKSSGGGKGCALFLVAVASVPAGLWWLVTR